MLDVGELRSMLQQHSDRISEYNEICKLSVDESKLAIEIAKDALNDGLLYKLSLYQDHKPADFVFMLREDDKITLLYHSKSIVKQILASENANIKINPEFNELKNPFTQQSAEQNGKEWGILVENEKGEKEVIQL